MGVRDPVGEQAVTVRQGLEQDNSQSSGFRVPRGRRDRQGEVSQREERGREAESERQRDTSMHTCTGSGDQQIEAGDSPRDSS